MPRYLLLRADARTIPLADRSVHCVVTSPPYYGLRDYGTATWIGGNADCDHKPNGRPRSSRPKNGLTGGTATVDAGTIIRHDCHCGAQRIDQQIGLESTPDAYVATMVRVFREVRRVLRDDGTCWLNLGDSYSTIAGTGRSGKTGIMMGGVDGCKRSLANRQSGSRIVPDGLKSKDLIGIPWRVAFALQADGWYLRSDIIWHKPNPMPESVQDRPTKAHEYLFLLSKSERYYYDSDAIREPHASPLISKRTMPVHVELGTGNARDRGRSVHDVGILNPDGRNTRSVWTITSHPFKGAHFATFPMKLAAKCIKAGTRKGDIVFDPFGGAMTTVIAADALGRHGIATELNPKYLQIGKRRIERPHARVPRSEPDASPGPLFAMLADQCG